MFIREKQAFAFKKQASTCIPQANGPAPQEWNTALPEWPVRLQAFAIAPQEWATDLQEWATTRLQSGLMPADYGLHKLLLEATQLLSAANNLVWQLARLLSGSILQRPAGNKQPFYIKPIAVTMHFCRPP